MANDKSLYTDSNLYSIEMQVLTRRIKEMRVAAGLTQRELAQQLGKKTHTSILTLEKGQVRIELLELRRICRVFGVPFREFILDVEDELEEVEREASEAQTERLSGIEP